MPGRRDRVRTGRRLQQCRRDVPDHGERERGPSATNTLTIRPAASQTPTISGSVASGALIKLNGADTSPSRSKQRRTDRSLTITNTNTTAPT